MFSSFGTHGSYHWWPTNVYGSSGTAAGWRLITGAETGSLSYTVVDTSIVNGGSCPDGSENVFTYYVSTISWTDPSGTVHGFSGDQVTLDKTCSASSQWVTAGVATDGSGYSVADDGSGSARIIDPSGTEVYPQIVDRYGNYFSTDGSGDVVDDTGRIPVIMSQNPQNANITYYDVVAPNGTSYPNEPGTRVRYKITTALIAVGTAFEYPADWGTIYEWYGGYTDPQTGIWWPETLSPVQSITLPDGSQYTFGYDTFGELSSMTLPTGGVITYGYEDYVDSAYTENRWLTSRTVGNNPSMTFTPWVVSNCQAYSNGCVENVGLQKPSGDTVVYELTLVNGAWNTGITTFVGQTAQKISQVTNINTYTNPCPPGSPCGYSNYISQTLQTTELFPSVAGAQPLYSQVQSVYNLYPSKPSVVKEWDYASSANMLLPPSTSPIRQTSYTYTGYDPHIVTVLGNGTQLAQTTYTYTSVASPTTGVVQHGTQNAGGPYLWTVSQWLDTGMPAVTTYSWDDTGQLQSVEDPDHHLPGTMSYQCGNSLPYQVSNALSESTIYGYDCGSGAIASVQGPNEISTFPWTGIAYYYEPLAGRPQSVTYPDGGATIYTYPSPQEVDTTTLATPDPSITTQSIVDIFGRPYQQVQSGIATETTYDVNGRVHCVTNPHDINGNADGSTCVTSYDVLDRPLGQQQPDSSTIGWSYSQNTVTETDENAKQTQRTSDAFGRLTNVSELLSGGAKYVSNYTYDGLGNLIKIAQLGNGTTDIPRIHAFRYDSMSRLVCASHPESSTAQCPTSTTSNYTPGTLGYGYDQNGNVTTKTDARGVQVYLSYDAVNRLMGKTYSDGTPAACFQYGEAANGWLTIGRLANEWTEKTYCHSSPPQSVLSLRSYGYDRMGRIQYSTSCTGIRCSQLAYRSLTYTYDLAGNRTGSTDGVSARAFISQYDQAGRLLTFNNDLSGVLTPLFSVQTYDPKGWSTAKLGSNMTAQQGYDKRSRPTSVTVTTP